MLSLEGREIGGCKLIRKIGEGGMGEVYLAEQLGSGNRMVAMKIVQAGDASSSASATADVARRFKREAAILTSLQHPHILPIYGGGVEGDLLYIIMPYAQEGSLSDAAHGRFGPRLALPVAVDFAVDIIDQVASALQYCHDRGIVHRDVKPANVLIRTEPGGHWHLLLADFGVARPEQAGTHQTMVTGTFAYMAPEQFAGEFSPASDEYALGVMAYQLLAGRVPFEGDLIALSRAHLYDSPPPLRQFNPKVPPGVESVIRHALAKDPAERYPSVAMFAEALRATASGVPYERAPGARVATRHEIGARATPAPRNTPAPPSKGGRAPSWPVDLEPPKRRRGNGRLIAVLAGILLLVGLVVAPGILNAREQQLEAQRAAATQTALASGTGSAGTTPSVTTTQTVTGSPTVSPTATPNFAIPTATAPAQVDTDMGAPPPTPLGTGPQKLADPSPMCDSPSGPPWVLVDQTGITCVASSDGGVTVAAKAAPRLGCIQQQTAAPASGYVDALAAPGSGNVVLGFRLAANGGRAGYYFSVNPASNAYDLYRLDKDGNKSEIKSDTLPKTLAAHFDLGASFNGGSIALYINGNRIAQASDTTFSSGAMGLCSDGSATFRDARIFAAAG